MTAREQAQRLLLHYLTLAAEGDTSFLLDADCFAEIDAIVDHIIAAAVAEALRQLRGAEVTP